MMMKKEKVVFFRRPKVSISVASCSLLSLTFCFPQIHSNSAMLCPLSSLLQELVQKKGHRFFVSKDVGQSNCGDYLPLARAVERGRVVLTDKHLQFLEQSTGTIEHFTDLLYDTPALDLIRNNCWLVRRQGVHVPKSLYPSKKNMHARAHKCTHLLKHSLTSEKQWTAVGKMNHTSMDDVEWRLRVRMGEEEDNLIWTEVVGERDILEVREQRKQKQKSCFFFLL